MKRFDMCCAPIHGTSLMVYSVWDNLGWYRFDWMPDENAALATLEWLNEAAADGRLVTPVYTLSDDTDEG